MLFKSKILKMQWKVQELPGRIDCDFSVFQKRSHQPQKKWNFQICARTRLRRKNTVTMCLTSTQALWQCLVLQKLKGKLTSPYNKGFFALNFKCCKDM